MLSPSAHLTIAPRQSWIGGRGLKPLTNSFTMLIGSTLLCSIAVAQSTPTSSVSGVQFDSGAWSFRAVVVRGSAVAQQVSQVIGVRQDASTSDSEEFNVILYTRAGESTDWTARAWNSSATDALSAISEQIGLDTHSLTEWSNDLGLGDLTHSEVALISESYAGGFSTADPLSEVVSESPIRDEMVALLVDIGYPVADVPMERAASGGIETTSAMLGAIAEASFAHENDPNTESALGNFVGSSQATIIGGIGGVEIIYPRPDVPTSTIPAWVATNCDLDINPYGWQNCCEWTRGPYIVTRFRTRARVNPATGQYQYCDQTDSCSRSDRVTCCTGGPISTLPSPIPAQTAAPNCTFTWVWASYAQCSGWVPPCPF